MDPIMLVHIVGGSVSLLAGTGALVLRKGSRWHLRAGTAFFAAMMVMAGTGAVIAALKPERGTAVIGLFTCYLVVTGWSAARRRDGRPGWLDQGAFVLGLACLAAFISFGFTGLGAANGRVDSLPWQIHFIFGAVAAIGTGLDINFLVRGQLFGKQRIGRHLWRMATAMLIATSSFFQGQQDEFPEAWRGFWLWSALPLLVLATMLFWIVRVRFSKAFAKWPPRPRKPEEAD